MTPERWQKIERLYHDALGREPDQRPAFLAAACAGDGALRKEVESLLAQDSSQTGTLDKPAWAGATELPGTDSTVTAIAPGTQLGPYKIEGPLGKGGMGEVFRAVDTRLGRPVAIKTSQAQFSGRFEREARAIAQLNHPNICTLFDIGPNYLVMELVEGETLAARLKKGPLPMDQVLKLGAQIADALAAAHIKGIVHRDVKPANVMIARTGVKVLDFGIAKSDADHTLTGRHVAMGTPAYMSPEQRDGKGGDARSDIYSLGLVLREMATGTRLGAMPDLSAAFVHIVERCLAAEAEDRWHSAGDIREELEWAAKSPPKEAAIDSLAVMPFENVGGNPDTEYLSDGITESLINSLSRISSLRVVSRSRVFRYKGKEIDTVQASRDLNVRALLTGRVSLRGDVLALQAELVEAATETQLWGERFRRTFVDIFEIEEEVSGQITRNLQLRLSGEDKRALAGRYKGSADAYQFFLRGQHHSKKRAPGSIAKAVGYFREAISLDPAYALAYEGLAKCNLVLSLFNAGEPRPLLEQGKAWASRAAELDPTSGNSRATMALLYARADWDWARANAEIEKAMRLSPDDFQVHDSAALVFAGQGRMAETLREIRKALELDPLALQLQHHAAWFFILNRQFDEALEQTRQMIELDAGYPFAYLWRGISFERLARYAEAEQALRKAIELFGGGALPPFNGVLAHCLAVAGRDRDARNILQELENLSEREYVDPFGLCLIHLGLGEHEEALRNLEQGARARSVWSTMHLMSDARLDPLRADPRFRQILVGMGLS